MGTDKIYPQDLACYCTGEEMLWRIKQRANVHAHTHTHTHTHAQSLSLSHSPTLPHTHFVCAYACTYINPCN